MTTKSSILKITVTMQFHKNSLQNPGRYNIWCSSHGEEPLMELDCKYLINVLSICSNKHPFLTIMSKVHLSPFRN